MHDLRIAFTIWGFLDPAPPGDLVAIRRRVFEGVANSLHHYEERRALVDSVPDATLRPDPGPGPQRSTPPAGAPCSDVDAEPSERRGAIGGHR